MPAEWLHKLENFIKRLHPRLEIIERNEPFRQPKFQIFVFTYHCLFKLAEEAQ